MPDSLDSLAPAAADHDLAHDLATRAGQLLLEVRSSMVGTSSAELKAAGDSQSNRWLVDQLRSDRPDDALLSEEERERTEAIEERLISRRVWIVDPLDGTREFSEPPRSDWAVHVALCIDGQAVCGAVALPALGITFSTAEPPAIPPAVDGPPRILVSRTRPPAEAAAVQAALDGELVPMGSAGAKAMAILRGEADIYPHSGGQYEWDSCAPVAVALAAGLWCSRIDGSPLRYNQADPYLPDLLICRPELADATLAAIRA